MSEFNSSGFKIDEIGGSRNAIKPSVANELVDALNILGKIKVVWGKKTRAIYADNGVMIELNPAESSQIQSISSASCLRVKSITGERITCHTWDGTTEGDTDIYVAKSFDTRQPDSETIAGTAYTYTYTSVDSYNDTRDSDDGTDVETQVVVPYWTADCLIHVSRISFSGVNDPDDNDIKLIEVSARAWAKVTV